MIKTKDKILNKAIEMYNTLGVANVSIRNISSELGISHGNLEYHFKTKSILINAIYSKMRESIAHVYEDSELELNPLVHFQNLLTELETLQQTFLFFNLDLLDISRKFPEVKNKLDDTSLLRKRQTAIIIKRFIKSNYFESEPFEDCYMSLQHTIRILISFWKSQEEILVSFPSSKKNEMSLHICSLLQPHLTHGGLCSF